MDLAAKRFADFSNPRRRAANLDLSEVLKASQQYRFCRNKSLDESAAQRIKQGVDGKKFKISDDVFDLLENSGYDSDVESDVGGDGDRTAGPLLKRHAGQILVFTIELPFCNDW